MKPLSIPALALLAACSGVPGLDHPQVSAVPYYGALQLRGKASMHSASPGGPIAANSAVDLQSHLGVTRRDDEWGGTVRVGDGFSGIEASYLNVDMKGSRKGTLPDEFGALQTGDLVRTRVKMDDWRLRYVAKVLENAPEQELRLEAGLGAMLAHRELDLRAREESGARTQRIEASDDGVPYGCVRGRAGWKGFALQVDYGLGPDLAFGGDFDGVLHDLEATLSWQVPHQDVKLFAGYRRVELEASGHEGGLAWDLDLNLDGWVLGVEIVL